MNNVQCILRIMYIISSFYVCHYHDDNDQDYLNRDTGCHNLMKIIIMMIMKMIVVFMMMTMIRIISIVTLAVII